jgi:hypothetical protein
MITICPVQVIQLWNTDINHKYNITHLSKGTHTNRSNQGCMWDIRNAQDVIHIKNYYLPILKNGVEKWT